MVSSQIQLVGEAITNFKERKEDHLATNSMFGAHLGAAYLSQVAACSSHERQQVTLGGVRLANEGEIFVVVRANGTYTSYSPKQILLDSGAQLVFIGKNLAQELRLQALDLIPCPYSILTSVGGKETVTGQTKYPLQLVFRVGDGPTYAHFSLKCVMIGATNYDILVGQQVFILLVSDWTTGPRRHGFVQVGLSETARRKQYL